MPVSLFLVDPPGVEPAHPQHRFCLPIGCGGFPPSVYTHLISELSAYCVGLRQARAFTSPKFFWLHLHSLLVGCAPIYFNVPGALKAGMPPTSHCCATSIRRFQRCLRTAYFFSSGTRTRTRGPRGYGPRELPTALSRSKSIRF